MRYARTFSVIAAATLLSVTVVNLPSPMASAGTLETTSVGVSWDGPLRMPLDDCTAWPFTVTNNSGEVITSAYWTLQSSKTLKLSAYTGRLQPGQSETIWIKQVCSDYSADFVAGTTGRITVSFQESRPWRKEEASFPISILPPLPQRLVEARKSPCGGRKSVPAKYCVSPWVFMIKDAQAFGSSGTGVTLYNRKGEVATWDDEFGDLSMSGAGMSGTSYVRVNHRDLIRGRYLVVARSERRPSTSCRVDGSYLTCSRNPGWSSAIAYTFNWNGKRVSNVKRIPPKNIEKVRL